MSARAEVNGPTSAAANVNNKTERPNRKIMRPLHAPESAALQSPEPCRHRRISACFCARGLDCALEPFTLHSAASANMGSPHICNRGFIVMAALAKVCRAAAWCALMACSAANAAGAWCALMGCAAANAAEPEPRAPAKAACLNAAETRELVKSRRLIEPFAALKSAGAQRKAEALSAKLCRAGDEFVYEITLLHRDGRLVHVEMEAATGKIASRPVREPHEPHEAHEPHEPVKN
jgi:uncharacterized membrane protein YkoI